MILLAGAFWLDLIRSTLSPLARVLWTVGEGSLGSLPSGMGVGGITSKSRDIAPCLWDGRIP